MFNIFNLDKRFESVQQGIMLIGERFWTFQASISFFPAIVREIMWLDN